MVEAILEQCYYETATYTRTLEHLTNENINLKNRLTALVQCSVNTEFLEKAEYFQSNFICEDEAVKIMRHDVAFLKELLNMPFVGEDDVLKEIQKLRLRLHREMDGLETRFNKLKYNFYHYLGEFLGLVTVAAE